MKIRANAKINLSLCIKGKLDNGYHLIDTVMHSVNLFDEIYIEKAEQITVRCVGDKIPMEENIAYKAAKLFFEEYSVCGGADIEIKKNIPLSAGLGGGSADAAAVLVGLNKLYNAGVSKYKLHKSALKLGADVPFFINGGCARAEGIGEILTDVSPLNTGYFLLAKADEKPSTAEMYRLIDNRKNIICDTEKIIKSIENNDIYRLSECMINSFSAVWNESRVKQMLYSLSPIAVSLSGSGPTWFAIFGEKNAALKAQRILQENNIDSWLTTPQKSAVIFV